MIEYEKIRDYLRRAYMIAWAWSDDRDTKTASLLLDVGWDQVGGLQAMLLAEANRLPLGIRGTEENLTRPEKYHNIIHAERAVIYRAARRGIRTQGKTLLATWACCRGCAQAIIDAGISRVISHAAMHQKYKELSDHWDSEVDKGLAMLKEAGVRHECFEDQIGGCKSLARGQVWEP